MQELLLIEETQSSKKWALEIQQALLDNGVDHAPVVRDDWRPDSRDHRAQVGLDHLLLGEGYRISCKIDGLFFDIWAWDHPGTNPPMGLWAGKIENPSTAFWNDDVFSGAVSDMKDLEEVISAALGYHQWVAEK